MANTTLRLHWVTLGCGNFVMYFTTNIKIMIMIKEQFKLTQLLIISYFSISLLYMVPLRYNLLCGIKGIKRLLPTHLKQGEAKKES